MTVETYFNVLFCPSIQCNLKLATFKGFIRTKIYLRVVLQHPSVKPTTSWTSVQHPTTKPKIQTSGSGATQHYIPPHFLESLVLSSTRHRSLRLLPNQPPGQASKPSAKLWHVYEPTLLTKMLWPCQVSNPQRLTHKSSIH